MITVHRSGPLALIQDLGRFGYADLGVSPAGAADRGALRAGNRLVGNAEQTAGIEITLGGFAFDTDRPLWCAVTGPETTMVINDRAAGSHHCVHLDPGDRVSIEPPPTGLRNYLAIRGGVDVRPVLGSRSADLLSGLGPSALQPGDRIPVGAATDPLPDTDIGLPPRLQHPGEPVRVEVEPGPRADWFTPAARERLLTSVWTVGSDSDRTAARLDGRALERRRAQELPSEGLVRGAVQVPGSGLPLIFGSNHPTTGGYPVIAVVTAEGCDRVAQLRPGDRIRFDRPRGGPSSRQ